MAFINKLFPPRQRKNNQHDCQCPTNVDHKLFTFTVEQIHIALFKECDFRGRRLLFDSNSVEKQRLEKQPESRVQQHFVEITNGYGYKITQARTDLAELRELVFGTIAMAYRGSLNKIHTLGLPPRLVFSQVFPTPRMRPEEYASRSSCSDHLSTASDTLIICRRQPGAPPAHSSLISSSGYGGDHSHSSPSSHSSDFSLASGPPSVPIDLNESPACVSSTSIPEKRYSTSSHRSLPGSLSFDDSPRLRHRRASKLGLAIIIQLPNEDEDEFETFLMQHVAVIDSMLWKVRQSVEIAYIRQKTFISAMMDVYETTAKWFVDFISPTMLSQSVWTQFALCDIPQRIQTDFETHLALGMSPTSIPDAYNFRNLARKWFRPSPAIAPSCSCNCEHVTSFIVDLCELVETLDVKHTNFFLSTLITGILTHHLGWVETVLGDEEIQCQRPEDLLVRQMSELYGSTGFPSKLSHTIIAGSNQQVKVIQKLLTIITYFIRCVNVQYLNYDHIDLAPSKVVLDEFKNSPMNQSASIDTKTPDVELRDKRKKEKTLKKSRTCFNDLGELCQHLEVVENVAGNEMPESQSKVLFVLGENEKLEKLGLSEGAKPKKILKEESQSEKKRYAGVKFNFQQHPQIFENYMKSKNIELTEMHTQKLLHVDGFFNYQSIGDLGDVEDSETLQTPSNASEMEYASELILESPAQLQAIETREEERKVCDFSRCNLPNTLIMPEVTAQTLKFEEIPIPEYGTMPLECKHPSRWHFSQTLLRTKCANNQSYLPYVALQGVFDHDREWLSELKKNLILSAKHPLGGGVVDEAVAIVANVNQWDVRVISSHTYVIDKNANGVPVGMSQLVANMLETLMAMWKLHTPAEFCLMHIEHKLQEFCVKSKAVAQLLLDTEYCTMELLTSTLNLEPNDVPLLLAIASLHTPKVTQKYGLRFQ